MKSAQVPVKSQAVISSLRSGEIKSVLNPRSGFHPAQRDFTHIVNFTRPQDGFSCKKRLENRVSFCMVEMRRVELLSEGTSSGTSPGAGDCLHSLAQAETAILKSLVASLCMARSKLCALTFSTKRRSCPGRGPPGRNGSLLMQLQEQFCCCSLIYKVCPF